MAEKYIPFSGEEVLDKLIATKFSESDSVAQLRLFYKKMEHYFHFDAFAINKQLKQNYAQFDPDRFSEERAFFENKNTLNEFKNSFEKILERGNFFKVDNATIENSFKTSDLVGLNLHIDFNDFKEYKMFARGRSKGIEKVKKWYFWKKEVEIEYYDRLVLYLHFNDETHFKTKNKQLKESAYSPNTIVLKSFKRVPVNDIETIFPNAEPRMSLKDKLLLWVPAIGGGIPIITTKLVPAFMKINEAYSNNSISNIDSIKTTLIQSGAILGGLGAYLFQQYSEYKNKKNEFQKLLTDSLYFKNLGNNSGVFHSLLDTSEEEELKEAFLSYSFLLLSSEAIDSNQLDKQIEEWFSTTLKRSIDFDIEDGLQKLKRLELITEKEGKWEAISLKEGLQKLDNHWNNSI